MGSNAVGMMSFSAVQRDQNQVLVLVVLHRQVRHQPVPVPGKIHGDHKPADAAVHACRDQQQV